MKPRSPWLIFTLVAIAQFMVVLDVSITNVALPTIEAQLHFTSSSLQWVITAYALTFGGFLLLGGRTADLFGRRRTLLLGMAAFTIFSLFIGLSHSATALIVLRTLQGLAAAFMSPSALSIVLVTFSEGEARNRALAYWTLVATGGAAIGLLLGGVLTQTLGWRWNFFVNIPVGIAIIAAIYKIVPKIEPGENTKDRKSLDLPGAILITSSLILQVLAFSQASNWGWLSLKTLSVLGLALVLLIGFLFNESKSRHPLMPLSILKIRNVLGANAIMAPMYGAMLGMFFLTTLYIQNILKYQPLKTGLTLLPFPIILAIMSTRIPRLVARYGFKRFLIIGPLIAAAGLLWMTQLPETGGNYIFNLLPAFLLMPIGVGMTFMPIFAAATYGVPANEAGLASGLITTSQQMGGALGLSILSGIAASATNAAKGLTQSQALVHGFDRGYLAAVAFMLLAIIIAISVIKQPKKVSNNIESINPNLV